MYWLQINIPSFNPKEAKKNTKPEHYPRIKGDIPETPTHGQRITILSGIFQSILYNMGFYHNTNSQHYLQSNEFIERQIQTVKRILTKTDTEIALLLERNAVRKESPFPG